MSFSSLEGRKNLLAAGRSNGAFIVMSLSEPTPRFEIQQPHAVACLSWRPRPVLRFSSKPCSSNILIPTEDLIVGDEFGQLYYYLVEWPESDKDLWPGSVSLVVRISSHNQQICGLAWSSNGDLFASGANDNMCALFEVNEILSSEHLGITSDSQSNFDVFTRDGTNQQCQVQIPTGSERLRYRGFDGQENYDLSPRIRPEIIRIIPNSARRLASGCELHV